MAVLVDQNGLNAGARISGQDPEVGRVVDWLRAALGTGPLGSKVADGDSPGFLASVRRHRVGPFLYRRLERPLAPAGPSPVIEGLRRLAGSNLQKALAQAAEEARLADLLEAEGVPVLRVK